MPSSLLLSWPTWTLHTFGLRTLVGTGLRSTAFKAKTLPIHFFRSFFFLHNFFFRLKCSETYTKKILWLTLFEGGERVCRSLSRIEVKCKCIYMYAYYVESFWYICFIKLVENCLIKLLKYNITLSGWIERASAINWNRALMLQQMRTDERSVLQLTFLFAKFCRKIIPTWWTKISLFP